MVRIGSCIACQYGYHEGHQRVIQAVPEGVMGGARCDCKGECQGKPEQHIQREMDAISRAMRKVHPDPASTEESSS